MSHLVWLAQPVGKRSATVLFLHGLGGHAYDTWRANPSEKPWPIWLAEDLDGVAVGTLGYAASASGWTGTAMSLPDRAKNVAEWVFSSLGEDGEPLFLVCHSLGGLVAKELVTMAASGQHFGEKGEELVRRLRGVVFYGTPHSGSQIANWVNRLRFLVFPTPTIAYLARSSAELNRLNQAYRNWAAKAQVNHLTVTESSPTLFGMIVKPADGDPGIPNSQIYPGDGNHFSICKPSGRNDQLYIWARDFLAAAISKAGTRRTQQAAGHAPAQITDPLPPIPRGQPVIIPHLVLRGLLVFVVLAIIARGTLTWIEDPFLSEVRTTLAQANATPQQATEITDNVVEKLKKANLSDEAILKFLKLVNYKVTTDPASLDQAFDALIERSEALQIRAQELQNQSDPELKLLGEKAGAELRRGELELASRLTAAAQLRAQLVPDAPFVPEGTGSNIRFTNGWDQQNITRVQLPGISLKTMDGGGIDGFRFNRRGAQQLTAAFEELKSAGLLDQLVFCGSYAPRALRPQANVLSSHAYGLALDLNCSSYPFGRVVDLTKDSFFSRVVAIFEKHGFVWGGRFTKPDPMHFQLYQFDP